MELLEDVEYPDMPAYDYSADADSANDSTDDTSDDTTNDTAEAPAAPAAPIAPTGGTSTAALDGTASAPAAAVADDGNVLGLNRGEGTITADTANNSVPNKIEASVDLQESNGQIDQNLVTIDGGKTALSGNIVTDAADAQGMSWWWIVVIALLGKAGRDMYRKHMEKKGIFVEVKKED
ncbi:MAG: hypothetical protein K5888_05170 [Lachnospiraceae bacterium]|nr:hypothetical protein [Lachnospiraceae bacterium]